MKLLHNTLDYMYAKKQLKRSILKGGSHGKGCRNAKVKDDSLYLGIEMRETSKCCGGEKKMEVQ